MKTTLCIFSFCLVVLCGCTSQTVEQKTNWVYDQEEVLSENEEDALNELIRRFEKETTNEIVIVTTADIGEHEKMVFYAVEFGDRLGIGKKDKNNGLIIAFSSTLHETFIATGLGTEYILTDPICKSIIDEQMVPNFRDGYYYRGLESGLKECIKIWKDKAGRDSR